MTYLKSFIVLMLVLLFSGNVDAQSSANKLLEKRFAGAWVNKKSTRHLEIYFEDGYATIMDWTAKFQKRGSSDVYKAFPENGKLVMPEETEHHAPYSEIIFENNRLIYLTKVSQNGKTITWDRIVFTRSPK